LFGNAHAGLTLDSAGEGATAAGLDAAGALMTMRKGVWACGMIGV
jgi:hypothetical protein